MFTLTSFRIIRTRTPAARSTYWESVVRTVWEHWKHRLRVAPLVVGSNCISSFSSTSRRTEDVYFRHRSLFLTHTPSVGPKWPEVEFGRRTRTRHHTSIYGERISIIINGSTTTIIVPDTPAGLNVAIVIRFWRVIKNE